tara:strand:- start:3514 stop:4845 length:1332 start_codon:yes stop_codon:yes gene_type:complete
VNSVGICLLARMGSKRLPKKALLPIKRKPTILHLIERLSRTEFKIVACIPDLKEDDILSDIIESSGIDVYRGFNDDPLYRMIEVSEKFNFKNVIRVTHDDIVIDTKIMTRMVKYHLKTNLDYTYTSLIPEGCGSEIFKLESLKKARKLHADAKFEGISNYFRNSRFNYDQYIPNYEYHYPARVSLDTPNDYTVLKLLSDQLPFPFSKIRSLDIIHHFKRNPSIAEINKSPKVTIYIPNYNYAKYLDNAIQSAINQTYRDIEIIVIDDASTDSSFKVLNKYIYPLSPIKIIFNSENIGLPKTCNKAISMSNGTYILRIDADDKLKEDAVMNLVNFLEERPHIDAVYPGYFESNENMHVINEHSPPFENENHHPTGCLIKKRSWEDFKYNEILKGYESYDFFLRFINAYKIDYLKQPLWFKRVHSKNMSSKNLDERKKIKEEIEK